VRVEALAKFADRRSITQAPEVPPAGVEPADR
jgi:hypothetical protein